MVEFLPILERTEDMENFDLHYCMGCGSMLNEQPGFDFSQESWTCTVCGKINPNLKTELTQTS